MKSNINQALGTLIADLGEDEAVAYVRFALPRLRERRDALLTLLQQQNWDAAALLAHKLLSSVRAYDDGTLEAALLHIERKAVADISQPQAQQAVQATFDHVLAGIEAWLVQH